MHDLTAFLRARLDEDERVARAAVDFDYGVRDWADDGDPVNAHIARHDPARVLREVEAKRRLLEQFRLRGDSVRAVVRPVTGGVWDDLLRLLALPYDGHPDYREEWRP